jgi:hypothetical protein
MNEPNNSQPFYTMPSSELESKIDREIARVLPFFEVSQDELQGFEKYRLRRLLNDDEEVGFDRNIPGYSSTGNYLYFPQESKHSFVFSDYVIRHEAGHYIHFMINKNRTIWPKETPYPAILHSMLSLAEMVANYPNYMLGERSEAENLNPKMFDIAKEQFDKYGPSFLPRLARMTLDEAISRGIVGKYAFKFNPDSTITSVTKTA